MNEHRPTAPLKKRLTVIAIGALFLGVIAPWLGGRLVLGDVRSASTHEAAAPAPVAAEKVPAVEAGQFEVVVSDAGADPTTAARTGRTLASFYRLRAYPGAPPSIPHPVSKELVFSQDCGTCHTAGGWTPAYRAYAPPTPHREFENCMQCHVAVEDAGLFRSTGWRASDPPAIGGAALEGSPPPVPHPLQMRERCASCHTGPSAVAEVRTSHPERIHCQQCHVRQIDAGVFSRTGGGS